MFTSCNPHRLPQKRQNTIDLSGESVFFSIIFLGVSTFIRLRYRFSSFQFRSFLIMNLSPVETFCTIAEYGSVSEAARQLDCNRTKLSMAI
ncbi:LysR family transcriptional regulator, partial [Vibrio owensii]